MMRILACLLSLAALASAQVLTQDERDRALSELHATRKLFLDAVAGLTPAQWSYKPGAGAWSIAECAEHIALSEDALFDLVAKKVMSSPAQPEKKAEVRGKDEKVLAGLADRSRKYKAPPFLTPADRWPGRDSLIAHFRGSRDRTLAYVRTTGDDLRAHFATHPAAGLLDGYQWLLLIAGHTQRHVSQIEEVKASPGYPR
jgi:hypothetical protein